MLNKSNSVGSVRLFRFHGKTTEPISYVLMDQKAKVHFRLQQTFMNDNYLPVQKNLCGEEFGKKFNEIFL